MAIDIAASQEAVEALRTLAQQLPEAAEQLKSATTKLSSVYQENVEHLGPHAGKIEEVISFMVELVEESEDSILEIGPKVLSGAQRLEEYIGNDHYGHVKSK